MILLQCEKFSKEWRSKLVVFPRRPAIAGEGVLTKNKAMGLKVKVKVSFLSSKSR